MKFEKVCILSFLILAFICTLSNAQSHHVHWGTCSRGDIHLHREVVFHPSRFFLVSTGDYKFEQKTSVGFPKLITCVNVTDQYTNDKGGKATLTSGGPNYQHVELHFTSKRSRGYNFIVDIYGIDKTNNIPPYQLVGYGKK